MSITGKVKKQPKDYTVLDTWNMVAKNYNWSNQGTIRHIPASSPSDLFFTNPALVALVSQDREILTFERQDGVFDGKKAWRVMCRGVQVHIEYLH
jgi:hypothetical protein